MSNTVYLTLMGSQAYGTSLDKSDQDIYGITIPLKEDVFPHLRGEIPNFGRQKKRFDQWSEHKVIDTVEFVPEGITYKMIIEELKKRGID